MAEPDYAEEAERHRHLAEEYRAMAECTFDDGLRHHYSRLAAAYDGLADNEDRVARNLRTPN